MWYNYIRFDNPLEFGHNYLPEFVGSEHGQFDIYYLKDNLLKLLFYPVRIKKGLTLDYPFFDGFMFYVANPLFILFFAAAVRNVLRCSVNMVRIALCAAMAVMLICLCLHKTLGGWQFGARYTCDMLPMALMYMCLSGGVKRLKTWEKGAAVFGIAFNIYGALAMTFLFS